MTSDTGEGDPQGLQPHRAVWQCAERRQRHETPRPLTGRSPISYSRYWTASMLSGKSAHTITLRNQPRRTTSVHATCNMPQRVADVSEVEARRPEDLQVPAGNRLGGKRVQTLRDISTRIAPPALASRILVGSSMGLNGREQRKRAEDDEGEGRMDDGDRRCGHHPLFSWPMRITASSNL